MNNRLLTLAVWIYLSDGLFVFILSIKNDNPLTHAGHQYHPFNHSSHFYLLARMAIPQSVLTGI